MATNGKMVETNEIEMTLKEEVLVRFRHYPVICLEGVTKARKFLFIIDGILAGI
jgi:hypothetical protein